MNSKKKKKHCAIKINIMALGIHGMKRIHLRLDCWNAAPSRDSAFVVGKADEIHLMYTYNCLIKNLFLCVDVDSYLSFFSFEKIVSCLKNGELEMDRKKTKNIKRKSFLILVYCFEFAIFPLFFSSTT